MFFWTSYKPKYDKYDVPEWHADSEEEQAVDYDLISPCEFYRELFEFCEKGDNLFTSMWVSGRWPNCRIWLNADEMCTRWRAKRDRVALETLLNFERQLKKDRIILKEKNDVWKLRKQPSETFSAKLPSEIKRNLPLLSDNNSEKS